MSLLLLLAGNNISAAPEPEPLLIASFNNALTQSTQTRSTDRYGTRWRHIAGADMDTLAAVYMAHGIDDASGDYTIDEAAFEFDDGTTVPITFGGNRSLAVTAGATDVISDEINLTAVGKTLNRGDGFWIKTRVSLVAGATMPFNTRRTTTLSGQQVWWWNNAETTVSDVDTAGAFTSTGTAPQTLNNGLDPLIVGRRKPNQNLPAIFAIGDSITFGAGDSSFLAGSLPAAPAHHLGFATRALYGGSATNALPTCTLGLSGYRITQFLELTNWRDYLKYFTVVLESLQTNDSADTLSELQTEAAQLWEIFKNAGIQTVIKQEIWTKTNSTDNWATLANQTVFAEYASGGVIPEFSAWIADQVATNANLDYFVPQGHVINKSVDGVSRYWNVNGTANWMADDNTHPDRQGHLSTAETLRKLINVELLGATNEVPQQPGAPFITAGNTQLTVRLEAGYKGSFNITGYEIQYRESPSGTFTQVSGSWSNPAILDTLNVNITGLTNATAYDVQYRLVNSAGNSEWSSLTTATPNA